MPELCQPPHPYPRRPKITCPPGATDCHLHIYGPEHKYPPSSASRFAVPDALPAACHHLHDVLAIDRVVLIQPSGYGYDNRRQLDALAELARPARAVVAVPFDVSADDLKRLSEAGARGARIAIGHAGGPSFGQIPRFADKLAPFGWHLDFHIRRESEQEAVLARAEDILPKLPVDVVIAHMAGIKPKGGIGQADFQFLCELMGGGRCWLKLSCGYRLSAEPPYRDLVPFAQKLVETRLDRLLWGSDWPHVNFKGKMPNTTDQLDYLLDWVPDEEARKRILVDNPQSLYGF